MSFGEETYRLFQDRETAVKLLYNRYAKKLLAYSCKTYSIDKDEAWAIVYKTIYRIADVGKDYHFENEQRLTGFVFKTHINYLKNYFRDNKAFEKINTEVELTEFEAPEEETSPPNKLLSALQTELDKLEDWERILLLMRGQDMPYSEIAKFVNKPENQLKVYYARLKKQLLDNLNAK